MDRISLISNEVCVKRAEYKISFKDKSRFQRNASVHNVTVSRHLKSPEKKKDFASYTRVIEQ